jgi:hypothetical protein
MEATDGMPLALRLSEVLDTRAPWLLMKLFSQNLAKRGDRERLFLC